MSKYFVQLDRTVPAEDEGVDIASYAAARREAIRSLGEALRDDPGLLDQGRLRLDMLDEMGALVFCVSLSTMELLPNDGGSPPPACRC